jgi:hypothetical protein
MSGLWRLDDHRRNIRRRAFFVLAVAESDQDRHLMTVATLPHATPLSFASGHASERTAVVLTPSADPRQAPGSRQALVCSGSNTLVAYVPIDKNGCLRPPQPHPRSVRDLQIPIARPQPNRASSSPRFPPYEAFERRPPSGPVRLQRAASEPLQFRGHANRRLYLAFGREARLRASARERPECAPESSFDRKRKTAFRGIALRPSSCD